MKLFKFFVWFVPLVSAVDYKFLKVENFSSSNENVAVVETFVVSPSRINVTFTVKQPVDKIQVRTSNSCPKSFLNNFSST